MQAVAQAEGKATGRLRSGQQAEILAHHGAHHMDLWPLALQDFLPTLLTTLIYVAASTFSTFHTALGQVKYTDSSGGG